MASDWALVLLTFVYVSATVLILVANNRMVEATRKQVAQLQHEFSEQNRPHVAVLCESIRGGLVCLAIENTGRRPASNVRVAINKEFVAAISSDYLRQSVEQFTASSIYLSSGQKLYCCLGGPPEFANLKDVPALIDVSYTGGQSRYEEHSEIRLDGYAWALLYSSPHDDMVDQMKKIADELHRISGRRP